MQNELRTRARVIKALKGVSYKEIAASLEIHPNSFYNWLKGYFTLSAEKEKQLIELLNKLENT